MVKGRHDLMYQNLRSKGRMGSVGAFIMGTLKNRTPNSQKQPWAIWGHVSIYLIIYLSICRLYYHHIYTYVYIYIYIMLPSTGLHLCQGIQKFEAAQQVGRRGRIPLRSDCRPRWSHATIKVSQTVPRRRRLTYTDTYMYNRSQKVGT